MKNKILLVLLAIAVFIPSIVAIVSFNRNKNAPVSEQNVRTIEISDLAGDKFSFTKEDGGDPDGMIDFFLKMNKDAAKASALPDPLIGSDFFKVTMSSSQKEEQYQYYFSTNTQDAYYMTADGKAFKISAQHASQFVNSKYAASLYANAAVPTLSVSAQATVLPQSAQWEYKNSAGEFVLANAKTKSGTQTVSLEGGLELLFSLDPDYFNVKMTDVDTGSVIFNDEYDNIGTLSINQTMQLNVEVTAKWYEDAARDYRGELHYAFTSDIAAPAQFYLGDTEIENGMFTVVSATNIADPSKISFTSSPDIGYTPTFYLDGDHAIALIPIRADLEAGIYTLTFKYGGVSKDLILDVKQRNVRLFPYNVSAAIANATRTEATLAEFADTTAPIVRAGEGTQLWSGIFSNPVKLKHTSQYDGVVTTGFGHTRTITATGVSYTHEGVDYITASGANVFAVNRGKVVYTGYTALGGNTIVIEHGYGLKTWYCHLSEITVAVGDVVEIDQEIGVSGSTGFTNQNGVHYGMSVFDVAVSPYPMWDEEIKIVK